MRIAHAMPFGATLLPEGGATFRLWAPVASRIELVLKHPNGDEALDAPLSDGGWREVHVPKAEAGQRYQWRVHADPRTEGHGQQAAPVLVPDPASRSNPDGVHLPSELIDPSRFEWDEGWRGRPWTQAVCYELHIGTFTPEGSFDAAREKLPQLAALGITCLQLMPLSSFPGRFGWGYDGVLHYAPHVAYGRPDDLKALVQEAHRLGMMVMLDVVYNHFGPDGNYLPLYAPGFFTERHDTPWGAAINFDGADAGPVREFFIHNALYWLTEYQLDGLRFDAVHAMLDDGAPHIMEELSRRVRAECAGRQVHLVLENDYNDAQRLAPDASPGRFDAQWSGDFHHTLHVLLTGETEGYYGEYGEQPLQMLAQALTHGFAMEGAPHLADEALQARHPRRAATRPVPLSCILNFLQNHDQIGNRAFGERLSQLVASEPLHLAMAMLILNPAPPMLFMGEEHGATTPFLYFADWSGELRQAVTSGRRKEFAHFRAFSDPAARERIPDPCDEATFRRSKLDWASFAQDDARRWQAFCQSLITLRREAMQPHLPALASAGHSASLQARLLTVDWLFAQQGGSPARTLRMQVHLGTGRVALPPGDTSAPATAGHVEGHDIHNGDTTLFRFGDVADDHLGSWSGWWRWLTPN
jgi:maltooligosyltrehalose trehalohydrolase